MNLIKELVVALWQQNFDVLSDPKLIWTVYGLLFVILILENGILPAAFLPGDSLLVLTGVLAAKGAMNLPLVVAILTIGASLGCWLGFIQGRWLSNTKRVQQWLAHLPEQYHQRAYQLFHRYGLSALLIARFLAFVRTLCPIMAGLSGLASGRFQFFNWLSAFIWVLSLTLVGYFLSKTPFFLHYESELIFGLTVLPIILLLFGLISSIWIIYRRKHHNLDKK